MTTENSIFGLRYPPHAELHPTKEELRVFLESTKKNGQEPHGNDLAKYRELLTDMQQDVRGKMFHGVLRHSRFANPALKSEVEHYKFLLHALLSLDLKKPRVFIRRWTALAEELKDIAQYIRNNLLKIERVCEAAIVILLDLQIERKFENQLIDGIKAHFKEHLKDSLHRGPIAEQYIETVKKDVGMLSKETSAMLREDVYALVMLYEAIYDHAKKFAHDIDALMAKIKNTKNKSIDDDKELLTQLEQVLVSLISEYHFELTATEIRTETAHEDILLEKRREMIDYLFDLLRKERRTRDNRRTGGNRRRSDDQNRKEPERRRGTDRRSGKNRRRPLNLSS